MILLSERSNGANRATESRVPYMGGVMMLTKVLGHLGTIRVMFSLPCFCADSIYVVGDFNEWTPGATPLHRCMDGWCAEIELPAGCAYRYRYLVNNHRWLNDWHADCYVPNREGGDDSVIVTLLPHEMAGVEIICPYDGQPCMYELEVKHTEHIMMTLVCRCTRSNDV